MAKARLCPYDGCTVDISGDRPYAYKRDGIPSASAIAELLDDGKARSFAWSASAIAANLAIHDPERWASMATGPCDHDAKEYCDACAFIRSEFDRVWKAKAGLGTHVHHLACSWASGEEAEQDEVTAPYLDALAAFYQECEPDFELVERTVAYSDPRHHAYRGKFDFVGAVTLGGERRRLLGDIKTGAFYPASQTLQLAGYRYAQWLTRWENGTEHRDAPVPEVDGAAVLLLGGDATYRLIELPADREAHGTYLRLVDAWRYQRDMDRWKKEHPEYFGDPAAAKVPDSLADDLAASLETANA